MPTPEQLKMIRLEDTQNPLTWRFNLSTPFGVTSQELTLDVPEIADNLAAAHALGRRIWTDLIASAITRRCTLDFQELVRWKISPLPNLGATGGPTGSSNLPATNKFNSGCLVLHTGHTDSFARRRFFLPAMPAVWVVDGSLTPQGMTNLYRFSSIALMSFANAIGGSPMRWLIAYPDVGPVDIGNLRGVAFRTVEYVRVCKYCDKAPDSVPINWP